MDSIWNMMDEQMHTMDIGNIDDKLINHIERIAITKTLEYSHGNQVQAAKRLGVHRNTLYNKIKKYNIDVRSFKE